MVGDGANGERTLACPRSIHVESGNLHLDSQHAQLLELGGRTGLIIECIRRIQRAGYRNLSELFSCFHRHADTVDLACLAQSVNVIAPIRTEPDGTSWRQSIYFPFELTSRYGRGLSLEPEETGNEDSALYGSAVLNREAGELTLFLTNRGSEPLDFRMESGGNLRLLESLTMNHADHSAVNSPRGEILRPEPLAATLDDAGNVRTQLPGISWNLLRIKTASSRFPAVPGI